DKVASLSGQDWIDFLTQSVNDKTELSAETAQALLHAPYSQRSKHDLSQLLNFTEHWIKALPKNNQGSRSS
ncbi:MAG: DUF4381 domain-containing protein, partial [Gammaproteobacteria bacterium]|nr:DUF4381 domain-containing protein [Gammaproteobacteria bacterium]